MMKYRRFARNGVFVRECKEVLQECARCGEGAENGGVYNRRGAAPGWGMKPPLTKIYLHIVFATKFRQPFLADKAIRDQLHAYLSVICRNWECPSLAVGGVEDHVHILTRQSKHVTVPVLVRELKRESSKWVKVKANLPSFRWQGGYAAFSVSRWDVEKIKNYIMNQEEHHRRSTFPDEYRVLCRKHGVEIDERYVWD